MVASVAVAASTSASPIAARHEQVALESARRRRWGIEVRFRTYFLGNENPIYVFLF